MDEERDGDGETLEATGERSVAIDLLETAAGPAARSGRMAGEIGEGTVRGLQGRGTAETVVRATSGAGAERISRVASQVTVARSTPSSASRGASWTSAGAEEERRVETLPGDPLEWAAPTVMVKLGSETEARIGRFAVLRKLGEGGMGAVYSAYDEELDRRVAIKVVRGALAGDTLGHARMQREAQAMARLSHPNVVQVYDVGMHAGELFIAMEFVRGVTLERWEEAIDRGSEAGIGEIVAMYRQAGEGLAAAHAVGLVHRDFKPENVLVGEDGRARVLDFGIAAASGAEGAPRGREGRSGGGGGGGLLASDLTQTGSVMGTPAFMAPEQFLARPTDARTDQFSFCVSLYSALYGEEAFGGDSFVSRQAAVCGGEIADAPPGAKVPGWLRAVLLRGLQVLPEERFPSMAALLAALAADPEAARGRRLRTIGSIAGAALLSALVIVGAMVGWGVWQRRAAEEAALERLAAMERAVAERSAAGESAEAERVFSAFVGAPVNQGKEALALAWLGRAARAQSAGDSDRAVDAYAASYTVATSKVHQVAALTGLVRFFRERYRLRGLIKAVGALEEASAGAFEEEGLQEARLQASTAMRDFARAQEIAAASPASRPQARLVRIVEALTSAHESSLPPFPGGLWGASADGSLVAAAKGSVYWIERGIELRPLGERALGLESPLVLARPGGEVAGGTLVAGSASGEIVLMEVAREGQRELLRWPDVGAPRCAMVADLEGDGEASIYVGTGPYSRHVVELRPPSAEDPARVGWTMRAAAPAITARRSDVNSLFAADLDGDGVTEVIAALGAWRAYELHALRFDAGAGALATVARARLGNMQASWYRAPDGSRRIAAWKYDESLNPTALPSSGGRAPSGLHSLRFAEGRLEVVASQGISSALTVSLSEPMVADLDGDGVDEIVVHWRHHEDIGASGDRSTMVLIDDEAGGFINLPISGADLVSVVDLDGDGDDELIVNIGGPRLWVMGAGAGRLPLRERGEAVAAPALEGEEAQIWGRASALAAMGLEAQAVTALVSLADTLADPAATTTALTAAAQLADSQRDDGRAAELYARAASRSPSVKVAEETGLAAIDAYLRRGDQAAAEALAATLASAEAKRRAAARPTVSIDFKAPLASAWQIHRPLVPQRDPSAGALRVEATGSGPIAGLPITLSGGQVVVTVELLLRRVEWGQELRVGIEPTGGGLIGVNVRGRGGSGDQQALTGCVWPQGEAGAGTPIGPAQPLPAGRWRLRVAFDPKAQEVACTVWGPSGAELWYGRRSYRGEVALEGEGAVLISSQGPAGSAGWVSAELVSIEVVGASLREAAAPQEAAARHALVEGRLLDALAAMDGEEVADAGLEGMWRVSALSRLGRWEEAVAVLRPLLADAALAAAVDGPLTHLLRIAPETTIPLLRSAATGRSHRAMVTRTWELARRMQPWDRQMLEVLYRALADLEEERGEGVELAVMFEARAQVHARLGIFDRARRDYRAAITLLEGATVPEAELMATRVEALAWKIEEASAAIRGGDVAAGEAMMRALLAEPMNEAFVRDAVDVREEFARLR